MAVDSGISRLEAKKKVALVQLAEMTLDQKQEILDEWWSIEPEDEGWELLPIILQKALQKSDVPIFEPEDKEVEPLLLLSALDLLVGVRNEWLCSELDRSGIEVVSIIGETEPMVECPCCQMASLKKRGEYLVCRVCFWEDDGNDEPARFSSPNRMTLREGRSNFKKFGASDKRFAESVLSDGPLRYLRAE